ncbi:hypothetical protein CGC21_12720 [Leishmania donovani]|uniref:Uncharacterized protein n=1 Tax=Leishmania donovani TaxID=5661 RepID=A0A504XIN3_LEIDO|nr:hypothetical protein CGC21_12720 [Leishmania donovani]
MLRDLQRSAEPRVAHRAQRRSARPHTKSRRVCGITPPAEQLASTPPALLPAAASRPPLNESAARTDARAQLRQDRPLPSRKRSILAPLGWGSCRQRALVAARVPRLRGMSAWRLRAVAKSAARAAAVRSSGTPDLASPSTVPLCPHSQRPKTY